MPAANDTVVVVMVSRSTDAPSETDPAMIRAHPAGVILSSSSPDESEGGGDEGGVGASSARVARLAGASGYASCSARVSTSPSKSSNLTILVTTSASKASVRTVARTGASSSWRSSGLSGDGASD